MKRIAALLTVHNRKDKTLACLQRLYGQPIPQDYSLDVYLTDDGCTDGTPEAIRDQFPQTTIIPGDGNLFWNRGMIAAWKEAEKKNYDFYFWLNDDTYLFDNALSELLIDSVEYPDHIIVGATLDNTQKHVTYGGRTKQNFLITNLGKGILCDTFNGNVVLIPKRVYLTIGKLDPIFHHGIGDSDYGLRATEAGFKCIVATKAIGICDTHSTLPKWCNPQIKLTDRIRYLYTPGGNGNNPIQFFIFRYRHYGFLQAIMTLITNHIRVFFPNIKPKGADKY